MNLSGDVVRQGINTLYRGRIAGACRRLGIEDRVASLYWGVVFAMVDLTYTKAVDGVEATFTVTDFAELKHVETLYHERPVVERLLDEIDDGDVFYDVGSHHGLYACLISGKLRPHQVVAFEPDPNNVERLRENLARNDPTATVHQAALSNESGEVEFEARPGVEGQTSSLYKRREFPGETTTVPALRGDDVVARDDTPDPTVIKIDVEGNEYRVLDGFRETLSGGGCRLVYCEVHPKQLPKAGDSPEQVEDLLRDTGFSIERFEERGDQYHLRASKDIK